MRAWQVIGAAGVAMAAIALALAPDEDADLRVAFFPNVGHAIPIVMSETGAFEMDGITVRARIYDSGPQAIEALFSNAADLAYVGPGPAVGGHIRSDGGIVIISGAASGGSSLIVQPDSEIRKAADLAGSIIAAPQIANTQDVSLRTYIMQNGLESAERGGSVHIANLANPEIHAVFARGAIDAAWVPEPWATILVNELGGVRLFYEESLWPDEKFASVLVVARAEYLKENPALVSEWLDVHTDTAAWIEKNPAKAASIYEQFANRELRASFGEGIIAESFANVQMSADPLSESVAEFARRSYELGYLGRDGYNLDGIYAEDI